MSQASISIANGSGAAVRAAVNSALEAITTKQSGGTAPSTTYPFMEWADTANDLLKQRNAANSAWIIKGTLSAEYGGLPASGISYAPGSPALVDAANVQDAIDVVAAQISIFKDQSLASSGFQKLPGGLIIQWGSGTSSGDSTGNISITFPIAFPIAGLGFSLSTVGNAFGVYTVQGVFNGNTGMLGTASTSGTPTTGIGFTWIAIGF